MDPSIGKSFRNHSYSSKKDVTLTVFGRVPRYSPVDILGYEFCSTLPYAMKKKGRWQLSSMISEGSYDEEQPIMYSKHQCVFEEYPLLDTYFYDSISKRQIGCIDTSNRRLQTGRFNLKSIMYEMENEHTVTKKEKKAIEKQNSQKLKKERSLKKSYAHQREKQKVDDEDISVKRLRQDCVYIQENIHIKDLSMVNMVKSSPYRYRTRTNRKKNTLDTEILDDDLGLVDEESETDIPSIEHDSRPFIIAVDEFDSKPSINTYAKIKHKKKRPFHGLTHFSKKEYPTFVAEKIDSTNTDNFSAKNSEVIPLVSLTLSRDQFIKELKSILSFCKCWVSATIPIIILVDLDEFDESLQKSYILLKPTVLKDEDSILVEVLFNVANRSFNMNDLLDMTFVGVASVTEFVQSRLIPGTAKSSSVLPNILIFDESSHNVDNHSHVRKIDNSHSVYKYHNEWKCELKINEVDSMMNLYRNFNDVVEECCVCGNAIPWGKIVLMKECHHVVCENCLSNHIKYQLDAGNEDMTCPSHGCCVYLYAPTILSSVHWKSYCARLDLLRSVVLRMAGRPCFQCGSVLIRVDYSDTRNVDHEYLCVCDVNICRNCGQLPHRPICCDEMKQHNRKMTKFDDFELNAQKAQLAIVPQTKCFNCRAVIFPNEQLHKLTCTCCESFCKKCRSSYKDHKISCAKSTEHKWTFPFTTEVIPYQIPHLSGPKLYNLSVYLHILRRKSNLDRFNHDLSRVATSALITQGKSCSTDEMRFAYSEILRILESMYVAAYFSCGNDNSRKLELLKASTSHLLFYIGRIQLLMEEMRDMLKERGQRRVGHVLDGKYEQLRDHIDSAILYARKIFFLIKG